MFATLGLYTWFTKTISVQRQVVIRERKNTEKKRGFTQNESIMNYESVKQFGNENLEMTKYNDLVKAL